jgi:hypothetical protein
MERITLTKTEQGYTIDGVLCGDEKQTRLALKMKTLHDKFEVLCTNCYPDFTRWMMEDSETSLMSDGTWRNNAANLTNEEFIKKLGEQSDEYLIRAVSGLYISRSNPSLLPGGQKFDDFDWYLKVSRDELLKRGIKSREVTIKGKKKIRFEKLDTHTPIAPSPFK